MTTTGQPPDIRLNDAVVADKRLQHQIEAWTWLDQSITREQRQGFQDRFRSGAASTPSPVPNPLKTVPYFPQLDNGPEGWRQCQTSSIAMCLAALRFPGINDDTDYLRVVTRFGDTTSQATHTQALAYLQAPGRFRQDLTPEIAKAEIRAGRPVAVGVLHHGPVGAPSGGGHYIVLFGFTGSAWIVNDPYGELDLVRGGWAAVGGIHGMQRTYSFKNLNPRWLADGPATGWGWVFG